MPYASLHQPSIVSRAPIRIPPTHAVTLTDVVVTCYRQFPSLKLQAGQVLCVVYYNSVVTVARLPSDNIIHCVLDDVNIPMVVIRHAAGKLLRGQQRAKRCVISCLAFYLRLASNLPHNNAANIWAAREPSTGGPPGPRRSNPCVYLLITHFASESIRNPQP